MMRKSASFLMSLWFLLETIQQVTPVRANAEEKDPNLSPPSALNPIFLVTCMG